MTKLKLLYVDDERVNLTNFTIAFRENIRYTQQALDGKHSKFLRIMTVLRLLLLTSVCPA